jgi:integrase
VSQLVLSATWLERLPPELREAYERSAEHVRNIHTPNTQKAYRAAWEAWAAHCKRLALEPLPVAPEHLCAWLRSLRASPATVRLKLAALCALDQGHAVSVGDHERPALRRVPYVQRWLKGYALKTAGTPVREAPAMAVSDLERVIARMAEPGFNQSRKAHPVRFARDKCLVLLGAAGALRIGELGALELPTDVLLSARGLVVTVRKSKTRKTPRTVGILPQAKRSICPVEALEQWLRARGLEPGPLFLGISRGGELEQGERLTDGQLMRVVTERCRAAGVDAATSHSLRATCATLMKDKPTSTVMEHGGWSTPRMVVKYQRRGKLLDPDGATGGLFDER